MFVRRAGSRLFIVIIIVVLGSAALFLSVKAVGKLRFTNFVNVKVSKVQVGNIQSNLDAKVLIKSKNYKEYYGNQLRVKKIHVKRGDYVEKGQKLLSFDNGDLLTQLTQSQIQLENAILQKKQMIVSRDSFNKRKKSIQDEIDRIREIQEDNESFVDELEDSFDDNKKYSLEKGLVISNYNDEIDKLVKEGDELKKILSDLIRQRDAIPTISDDQIKLLDNAIVLAENNLKNIEEKGEAFKDIEAEFNGIVTDINITEGSYSQAGSTVLILQDDKNIKGISLIPQQNISKVKVGQQVLINDPVGMYSGKITDISNLAINTRDYLKIGGVTDLKDNSLIAEIEISNADSKLKIDFELDGKIILDDMKDILKVPIECVSYDDKNIPYVFIVKDGEALKKYIVTGEVSNNYIQVVEGVTTSDQLILNPNKDLGDKTKVRIVRKH